MVARVVMAVVVLASAPTLAAASGHGPVFGGATPTLGKGGWSLDQAWMGRASEDADPEQLLRTMISFGVTEDLQISASLPIPLATPSHMPTGRMMAMMSGHREMEGIAAWRFHRQPVGVGGRFESTIYLGGTVPLQNRNAGMSTKPSGSIAVATGYASRAHYLWVAGGYQRYGSSGERYGDVKYYSIVYGHRPRMLRFEYPRPDLRFFVEAVGESTGPAHHAPTGHWRTPRRSKGARRISRTSRSGRGSYPPDRANHASALQGVRCLRRSAISRLATPQVRSA